MSGDPLIDLALVLVVGMAGILAEGPIMLLAYLLRRGVS
jgi:hypothetical protein